MPKNWFKNLGKALEKLGYVLVLLFGGAVGLIVGTMAANTLILWMAWIFQRLTSLANFIFGGA